MNAAEQPEQIVFVGGAPRSGTTVAHALVCTAEDTNAYSPEISFFRGYMIAFRNGRAAWNQHTRAYFASPADFETLIRESADLALGRVWRALGAPRRLAVKDPHLTPFFPDLHRLYPTNARFLTMVRHPYDIVRSRQEVHDQSAPGRPFLPGDAVSVAREYLNYYSAVMRHDFQGRHLLLRYEDLGSETFNETLRRFVGADALDLTRLWGAAAGQPEDDAWGSPKYNGAIDLSPRLSPLAPALRDATRGVCGALMQTLDYPS